MTQEIPLYLKSLKYQEVGGGEWGVGSGGWGVGGGEWGMGAGKEGVALIVNQLTSFEGFVLICHTKYNNLNFEPQRCGKHLRCLPS